MTHINTSKAMDKNPLELVLGQKIRLPANIGFEACEKYLLKPQG